MKFEAHCAETIALFGKSFEQVHVWLDELAGREGIGLKHRRYRHHLKGVEEIRKMYGEMAARAAIQHIKTDLRQEGWTEKDGMPKDEADYVRMGLF
jgi:hypothetical protein